MKKMKFLAGILSGKELIKVKIKMNFFLHTCKKKATLRTQNWYSKDVIIWLIFVARVLIFGIK
jgi:hypothetical protein